MKSATKHLWLNTDEPREYINITEEAAQLVQDSGISEGMILVSAMHITAGVYVNDAEPGIIRDLDEWADRLAPKGPDYHHHRTGESNGDAHLKSILVHHQVVVPITDGQLDLGPWQQIYYAEFDGQRRKRVVLKAMESRGGAAAAESAFRVARAARQQVQAPPVVSFPPQRT